MNKTWIAVLVLALFGAGVLAFASGKNAPQQDGNDPSATGAIQVPAEPESSSGQAGQAETAEGPVAIQGVLEKTESGLSLFDGRNTYQLSDVGQVPGLDFETVEKMIGKRVQVDGELEKGEPGSLILVRAMVPVN